MSKIIAALIAASVAVTGFAADEGTAPAAPAKHAKKHVKKHHKAKKAAKAAAPQM
ncbi:hypothetical protein KSF73_09760 [Burkholderiaceae bacterium DAT-1]|nr:hypothetical protein [Burkholderiaceae bacterium DAT-1]